MFNGASEFNQKMCGWTVEGKDMFDGMFYMMFDGSLCSVESCIECPE